MEWEKSWRWSSSAVPSAVVRVGREDEGSIAVLRLGSDQVTDVAVLVHVARVRVVLVTLGREAFEEALFCGGSGPPGALPVFPLSVARYTYPKKAEGTPAT